MLKYSSEEVNEVQADRRTDDIAQLAKGAGISASGKMVGRGLNFLGQMVLARLLGPEAFGLYAIGWTLLRIVSIVGPLGLDSGVIRFGSKYWREDQQIFRSVFLLSSGVSLASGLIIGILLILTAPGLATQVFHKPGLVSVFRGFAWAIPLATTLRVVASATSVSKRLQYATYSEEISQPTVELVLVLVFFYLLGWKLEGAVLAGVLSFGAALALAAFFMIRLFPNVLRFKDPISNQAAFIQFDIIRFSIPTAFASLFGSFISWVDRLLVGFFRSSAETGVYTTISLVSIVFVIILSGIKVIFSPMIADLYYKDELKRVEEIYRISTKWGFYISIPLFLVVLFGSRELLGFVFGTEYINGYFPLIILAFGQLVNVGTGPIDVVLIMTGRQKSWLVISGLMLVVNIMINSFLIPAYGITGAAIGTASTVIGIFILGIIVIKRELNIWQYDRRYLKGLLSGSFTALILFSLRFINFHTQLLYLFMVILISFLVFMTGLLILGLDSEDIELYKLLKNKLSHLWLSR